MYRKRALIILLFIPICLLSFSQVRIRLLSNQKPGYLFFTAVSGHFKIDNYTGSPILISEGETFVLSQYKDRVAVKTSKGPGFSADSVLIKSSGESDRFLLRTEKLTKTDRIYSGDLQCFHDMGSLHLINVCNIEDYVAGVVKAEGGNGKKSEYFKTQAIIARTYTCKHQNRHILDRYNLCDDTHCQVYYGITSDTVINRSVRETSGIVIATSDSTLINSAFHSNCGGETSPSEYIWPSRLSYLVKVKDPYCLKSRNATWDKVITLGTWTDMLKKNGYDGSFDSSSVFSFRLDLRVQDYVTGGFSIPFNRIREELNLRSSWFSVIPAGDSIRLAGKGYGHGVGLCQEGAMVMAAKGFGFMEIINFYYPGVKLIRISDAKKSEEEKISGKN